MGWDGGDPGKKYLKKSKLVIAMLPSCVSPDILNPGWRSLSGSTVFVHQSRVCPAWHPGLCHNLVSDARESARNPIETQIWLPEFRLSL